MTECREAPALLIYTDASWTRRGSAWGAVIRGLGEEIVRGAAFKEQCVTSDLAELWGVANALHIAIADGRIRRGVCVTIVCDSQNVISRLTRNDPPGKRQRKQSVIEANRLHYKPAVQKIRDIIKDCGALVSFEWVKAHQNLAEGCPHREGNVRADKAARSANTTLETSAAKLARQAARRRRRRARQRINETARQAVSHGA